jgi:hypothetical protein
MKYTRLQHGLLEWAIACHIVISGTFIYQQDNFILSLAIWCYIFALLELYKSNSFTFPLDPGKSIDLKDDNTRIYGRQTEKGYQFGVENSR